MHYVLLVYQDEGDGLPPGLQRADRFGVGVGVLHDLRLAGSHATTTVRATPGGVLVQDGPFTGDCARLARLCVVEQGNLDEALVAAAELAGSAAGVEVRPLRAVR